MSTTEEFLWEDPMVYGRGPNTPRFPVTVEQEAAMREHPGVWMRVRSWKGLTSATTTQTKIRKGGFDFLDPEEWETRTGRVKEEDREHEEDASRLWMRFRGDDG